MMMAAAEAASLWAQPDLCRCKNFATDRQTNSSTGINLPKVI